MKTESSLNENKNKMRKIDKINKKSKTIQTKPGHSNSFKQRGNFSNNLNKYNISLSNKKDENNNSSILNDQKKNSLSINKHLNIKQNKLPINKKLNIIKEANENQIMVSKNINNNKKYNQRNNNINSKQIMMDKNKSYIAEEKKRLNMGKLGKKEGESFSLKRLTLQDNEKYFSNLKFNSNKSSNIDGFLYDKNKKEKEHSKNNQVINVHKNNNLHSNNMGNDINLKKNKLKKLLNIKKNNDANQDDIFVYDENKPITLTQEELDIYGDRNMKGYSKVRILGKGGYGVVWLCKKIDFNENDENNNMDYAVKQTSKKNAPAHNKEDVLQIAKNEIDILTFQNSLKRKKDIY